jgi:hypothetical protein
MALRAKWQFMDRSVTHKIVYGPQLRFSSYNILWVTSRSINCHMALSAMNYFINTTLILCLSYRKIINPTMFIFLIFSVNRKWTGFAIDSPNMWQTTVTNLFPQYHKTFQNNSTLYYCLITPLNPAQFPKNQHLYYLIFKLSLTRYIHMIQFL